MLNNKVLDNLDQVLATAIEDQDADLPATEELVALREDLDQLGFFGLLVVLAESPAPDEAIHKEHTSFIKARLLGGLKSQDAPAADAAGTEPAVEEASADATEDPALTEPLADIVTRYKEAKGAPGRSLARKAMENALFDCYELAEHGLFVDDVVKAVDLVRSTLSHKNDIKETIRCISRLSFETARFVLGLFPEQIQLIYRIGSRQAEQEEIDSVFDNFGPPAIRMRLFAITKTLLSKDVRFRLAINLYARGRGVAIAREQILGIEPFLDIKKTKNLIERAVERKEARRELLAFTEAHPDIAALDSL